MRNHASQLTIGIEHNPIRAGALAPIKHLLFQDRKLVPRPADGEVEALVVVVLVRVVVVADRLALRQVVAAGALRG